MRAEAATYVRRSAHHVLAFAANPYRYQQADSKIRAVLSWSPTGDHGRMRVLVRLAGLPLPGALHLEYRRVGDFRLRVRIVRTSLVRLFAEFDAAFTCIEDGEGTWVAHAEALRFRGPLEPMVRLLLARWFREELYAEVERLRQAVEEQIDEAARPAGPPRNPAGELPDVSEEVPLGR